MVEFCIFGICVGLVAIFRFSVGLVLVGDLGSEVRAWRVAGRQSGETGRGESKPSSRHARTAGKPRQKNSKIFEGAEFDGACSHAVRESGRGTRGEAGWKMGRAGVPPAVAGILPGTWSLALFFGRFNLLARVARCQADCEEPA